MKTSARILGLLAMACSVGLGLEWGGARHAEAGSSDARAVGWSEHRRVAARSGSRHQRVRRGSTRSEPSDQPRGNIRPRHLRSGQAALRAAPPRRESRRRPARSRDGGAHRHGETAHERLRHALGRPHPARGGGVGPRRDGAGGDAARKTAGTGPRAGAARRHFAVEPHGGAAGGAAGDVRGANGERCGAGARARPSIAGLAAILRSRSAHAPPSKQ